MLSSWTSEAGDIPNLKSFPAVFFVSARNIANVVKHMSDKMSTDKKGLKIDGGLPDACKKEFIPKMKAPTEEAETSDTDHVEEERDVSEIAFSSTLVFLDPKMWTGLQALISSLLPMTSAIYGAVAVSEWVLGMHTLLIIDDAEDFQSSELEFLQQVFRPKGGTDVTIIMLTDPYGYKRITESWKGMALSKLDLYGLGRADIVTEANCYLEAKRTEKSLKPDNSSLRSEIYEYVDMKEPTFREERPETNTSENHPQPVQKTSDISNEQEENFKFSALNTSKIKANEIKSTSTDESNGKSSKTTPSVKDQEIDKDKCPLNSKGSEDMSNPATFLDIMTGKKPIPKRKLCKKESTCCRSKGIGYFLSQNMCRLEKVLRFPEILIRTCDMFVDSLDLFDEITTATDLLWTLIHWEGVKAISLCDSNEDSQKCLSNSTDYLKPLECFMNTSKSTLDFKESENTIDSSKSSTKLHEPSKDCSVPSSKKLRDMDNTYYEKMYSWLLLIGEQSLVAFVNNDRMGGDDYGKLKTQTIEMFGNKVADIMMSRLFKYSDFFGISSIPENVESFVTEHLSTDHYSTTAIKCDTPDNEFATSGGDSSIMPTTNEHPANLPFKSPSPHGSFANEKILSPKETGIFVIATEKSEYAIEQNHLQAQDLVQVDQSQTELETPECISRHCLKGFTESCSSDDCEVKRINIDLKSNQPQCLPQGKTKSGNDTCSSDFWSEISGSENVSYLDSTDIVQDLNTYPNLNTSSPIKGKDSTVTGIRDDALVHVTERAQSPTASNNSVENSIEVFLNKRSLETLNKTGISEGVGNNLDYKDAEYSYVEQHSTTEPLICEKQKNFPLCETKIIETPLSDEECNISKDVPLRDDETFETNKILDNSCNDFWGEILSPNGNEMQNELKFEDNFVPSNFIEKTMLQNECYPSDHTKVKILKNEYSEGSTDQKANRSEIPARENINLGDNIDPIHEAKSLAVSFIENKDNDDVTEESKDHSLEIKNTQSINTNISDTVKPFQDIKNLQEDEENCFTILESHSMENISSNSRETSDIPVNTQIQQRQHRSDKNMEEITSLIVGGMADDCPQGNFPEKLFPTRSVMENSKEDTICEKLINGQPVLGDIRNDNGLYKNTNNQTDIMLSDFIELPTINNISIQEQVLCNTEDQEKQQTHGNSVNRGKQQMCDNDQSADEETAAIQDYPINDLMGSTKEVEKQQQINFERTLTEQHKSSRPIIGLSPENENTKLIKELRMQRRISKILEALENQIVPTPTRTLSTRNSVTTQFLASWFLVHEIQSGRSLASLTYGSRCSLRQLCIFSAGLINRIRKLVGYNSELNRRRVVCALLNYRFDSSDDLLFNMSLVAEFKAYPDLLSFTVEASEYPDEWHVSLYEAQLVPLQALLLNVAPSRIFLNIEEARPFSEASSVLEFLPRVEILVWLDSGCQFTYGNSDRMDKITASFTADVVLAKVELVAGCLSHDALVKLPSHGPFKDLVYLKLRVSDMFSLSSLLSIDCQLKALLWLEVKLDFDWLSEEEGHVNSLPRSSVPLFDVYLRDCVDEHIVQVSNLLAHMHLRYSGIHLESTSLTPEGVYVLLKQLQQKEVRLYSHPTARQRFRRWYYPQLADGPVPTDDLARERLGFDDRVFYSNHCVESSTYAIAIDAWNLTSFLEEENRIVHFVYTTENLKFVKRLTGNVEVENIDKR